MEQSSVVTPAFWVIAYGDGQNGARILEPGRIYTRRAEAMTAAREYCNGGGGRTASVVEQVTVYRSSLFVDCVWDAATVDFAQGSDT